MSQKVLTIPCKIYGIFDLKKKKILMVHLKLQEVELEYDLENYDTDRYKIISFLVNLN